MIQSTLLAGNRGGIALAVDIEMGFTDRLLVELEGGANDVAKVVRALDEAGIMFGALELVEPSLDDVFVTKTGYHLEAEEDDTGEHEADPA